MPVNSLHTHLKYHDPDCDLTATEPDQRRHVLNSYVQYCPVQNVTAHYPATLLLHGNRDTDVPYQQSVLVTEAFSRNNVEHKLITMYDQGHGFDGKMDDPTVMEAFAKVLAFLGRHTNTTKA